VHPWHAELLRCPGGVLGRARRRDELRRIQEHRHIKAIPPNFFRENKGKDRIKASSEYRDQQAIKVAHPLTDESSIDESQACTRQLGSHA